MDSSEALNMLRLSAAVLVLGYASILDWRTRKVPNPYWIGLTVLGLALLPVQISMDSEELSYLLILVPILAILSDVYLDPDGNGISARLSPWIKYSIAIVSMLVLGFYFGDNEYFQFMLAVPAMMLVIVALYMLDIIRGGADAKALLALTVLFPFYPYVSSLPLLRPETVAAEILFPFSLVVLINAAIIVAFFPIGFMILNLIRKEFEFPQGFLGYRLSTRELQGRHVWLMERMDGDKHLKYTKPKAEEDILKEAELLEEAGHARVWVTPKIPFIIPICAGLVLSATVGSLILLLFQI